jgi:hypothetical protein
MGEVYLAEDTELKRRVALKIPKLDSHNPEVRERFLREARAMAALEHRNICPVHDMGVIDGQLFLTMKFIEGRRLADRLAAGPLPPAEAAALVHKLALALERPHERGIVHRDLKPSNIMLDHDGEPVVLDFGVARWLEPNDPHLTKTGTVLGTPAYMAPEQVRGDVAAVGPASDVYSLGVILYQCLAGRVPFESHPLHVAMVQILTLTPTPPSQVRPGIDARLEAVCLRAMAKSPAERYPSMAALAAALADYREGRTPPPPVSVTPAAHGLPPPVVPQIVPPASAGAVGHVPNVPGGGTVETSPRASARQRNLLFVTVSGAALLVLAVLLVIALSGNKGGPETAKLKPKDEETAKGPEGEKKKEGPKLGGVDDDGLPRLKPAGPLKQVAQFEDKHRGGVTALALSTDGKRLVSAGEDRTLQLWDVPTGKQLASTTVLRPCKTVALAPLADFVLACDGPIEEGTGSVLRWDVKAALEDPKVVPELWWPRKGIFSDACSVAVTRNGRKALIGDWNGQAILLDIATGNVERVCKLSDADKEKAGENPLVPVLFAADGERFLAGEIVQRTLQFWRVKEKRRLCKLPPHLVEGRTPAYWGEKKLAGRMIADRIVAAVSADGARALTSSKDRFVRLWDLADDGGDAREVRRFEGHTGHVLAVAFSPDRRLAVSGARDDTLRLWEVASGAELSKGEGHLNDVSCVAFTPDGRHIVSGSRDRTLRVWAVPAEYLAAPQGRPEPEAKKP